MTTVADGLYQYGGMPVGPSGVPAPFTGNWYFVNPASGGDGNSGKSPTNAFATLYAAHAACTAGNNDVVVLMGNGSTTGSARLSTALAASVTSGATTGTLTWSKNATHLLGVTSPSMNPRARIAPPTGVYTQATFGSGNFVVVSAQGCYFSNISVFNGFSTGGTNQIAWTDSGGRNTYSNVSLFGMGDAASAADTGSHSLVLSGSTGENNFFGCQIGNDFSAARSAGVSELYFTGGSPRNRFNGCQISTWAGAAGAAWVEIPASGIDRYALFRDCAFNNAPGATTMTVGMLVNASPGGVVQMLNCLGTGATKFNTTAASVFTNQPAGNAAGGLGVAIT